MLKYFCDLCGEEIKKSESTIRLHLTSQAKSRLDDDDECGWGAADQHISLWICRPCLEKVIPQMEAVVKKAGSS